MIENEKIKVTDFENFKRASHTLATLFGTDKLTSALEGFVSDALGHTTDPDWVSIAALHKMRNHPGVYLGERTISGIVRRADLYSVSHDDPKIKAETEEWLWPLLPKLLSVAARAFSYGSNVAIFTWDRETLQTRVPKADGSGTRARNVQEHTHYVKVSEVRSDDVDEVEVDDSGDELVSLTTGGRKYDASRAHVFVWDQEFGSWRGRSALRRAWRDYCEYLIVKLLYARYLERSVDSPRVGRAPEGKVDLGDGKGEISLTDLMTELLMALRGSGVVTLPSRFDKEGNQLYDVKTLDLPDRTEAFQKAIGLYTVNILISYLVAPGLVGMEELGAAAGKVLDGMIREFIEDLATWAAAELTEIVSVVHAANYDPQKVSPPEIEATDVGKAAARKIMQSVLQLANAQPEGEIAQVTDVPKALDQLGVPTRLDGPLVGDAKAKGGPGRPREPTSDREERREDARTEEGEEATGAPDEGDE